MIDLSAASDDSLQPEVDDDDDDDGGGDDHSDVNASWRQWDGVPEYVCSLAGFARGEQIPPRSKWATSLAKWEEPRFSMETHDPSSHGGQSAVDRMNAIKDEREAILKANEWYVQWHGIECPTMHVSVCLCI